MKIERVIIIVMDSVGIGALPDAALYHDEGANTVGNIFKATGGLNIPNLCRLGLGKVEGMEYLPEPDVIVGSYGKMSEASAGKDTTTGHWELSGIQLENPFPVYPEGFPAEVMNLFMSAVGTGYLGNYPASGTEIIDRLGEEHMKTGNPIIYTSADSVFQIAAHEDIIPLKELYSMCETARKLLQGKHQVGRVIARPFIGTPGNFKRTANRRDFSLEPAGKTMLDLLKAHELEVLAVGKIEDIFACRGITFAVHTKGNADGINKTLSLIKEESKGLIFTNLVDFDMLFGHRNDIIGYRNALEEFDVRIPEIMEAMREEDLLIITADHGCDPTMPGTDHSREYVPLLIYGKGVKENVALGIRKTFADVAKTVLELFDIGNTINGESFAAFIQNGELNK